MEIGSFIELQLPKGKEYHNQTSGIARLNTGRAAIWHAYRVSGCNTIWLPYYQCDTVGEFLKRKNVNIKYYHIDNKFDPIDIKQEDNEAVLLVNYYGVMSKDRMKNLTKQYKNVILDNSQSFFSKPIEACLNVYSCRKFIGVPDGSYVIGKDAEKYIEEYEQCYSSDTSLFLLQRIEYGCEGISYQSRQLNEYRLDKEDCMKMSKLTHYILDGTDYDFIKQKRKENYLYVSSKLDKINLINPKEYYDDETVPMVYPLIVEDDGLLDKLQKEKHFQGHWWSYLIEEMPEDSFEYWLSRYMIPITIDQRYKENEISSLIELIIK